MDLYLRDNVRNRPEFLGEDKVSKEEAAAFYRRKRRNMHISGSMTDMTAGRCAR